MEKCTRIGCGANFDPSSNTLASCKFHPGAPLFHEGLKSYTCCKDTNKAVLTFDEFLALPGCTTGSHTTEKSEVKMPVVTANVSELQKVQIQSEKPVAPVIASTSNLSSARGPTTYRTRPVSPNTATANDSSPETAATNFAEEQDSADVVIPSGARCKRLGCGTPHESSMQRNESECTYHPLPAIFHEGSKGYACCKRRVLEFDEFLRIEGCKKGKHCFVGTPKTAGFQQEERVQCRSDMYQTPTQVIASIFGKGADKDRSIVKFAEWEMHVDLFLPANKRFTRTFELYGPIDISASVFRIMGTKVEMTLVKGDGRSWPSLEASKEGKSKFTPLVTFGVSGRTGSVGAKEMVYRGDVVHA